MEWLGEVPGHWSVCSLSYRYQIELGKMLDEKRITGEHLRPYLRNIDVQWGVINTDDLPEMDFQDDETERYALEVGDLLVCEGGEVGRAAIWKAPIAECYYQKALHRVRPRLPGSDIAGFLFFVLLAAASRGILSESAGKSTIAHLTAEVFRRYRFPFPPLAEQTAIATFLHYETDKIDALVADYRTLIELLQEKRQAVISHAVTKGLDSTVPMKDSGVEWLGEVPAHWGVVRLKFLATVQTGVAKGKDNSGKTVVDVAYLRVANVQNGYLDLAEVAMIEIPQEDLDRYLLRNGDVLMNEGGDNDKLGRGHIWGGEVSPCIHQNHVFAVRPIKLSSDWLNRVTGSSYAQFYFLSRSKQSTNLASISSTNIMELPVVLPPDIEQVVIGTFLDREISNLDSLITDAQDAITLLQERRTALISAAVTGKIDVRGLVEPEAA